MVLIAAGGFFAWRWWTGRAEAVPVGGDGAPAGITPEVQALIDSLRRTAAGGPQPGDTSSVEEPPAEEETPSEVIDENGIVVGVRADLLSRAQADPDFGGRYNVHQWNYLLRAVSGLSEAETPDLAGLGDPLDALTVDQFLARRTLAGLSGTSSVRTAHQSGRGRRSAGSMRGLGQLRRARYPIWPARPGGRTACGCAATGCNCYRV